MATFLQAQQQLAELHLDERSEWIAGGAKNKAAVNAGYSETYAKLANVSVGSRMLAKRKTQVTASGNVLAMPNDFLELCTDNDGQSCGLFRKIGDYYQPWDRDERPFNVRFDVSTNAYSIVLGESVSEQTYVDYVPTVQAMTNDADVLRLPPQLTESVADYALVEYYRRQNDWANVGNALQYAEGKIQERLARIWDN